MNKKDIPFCRWCESEKIYPITSVSEGKDIRDLAVACVNCGKITFFRTRKSEDEVSILVGEGVV